MIKVLALLFCCIATASAQATFTILNGRTATEGQAKGEFGFVAHVVICNRNGGSCVGCTGSVIDASKILLAAHCFCTFAKVDDTKIKVYAHTTRTNSGIERSAAFLKKLPYDCKNEHGFQGNVDIAIIRLTQPLDMVDPVPMHCNPVPQGTDVTMIGFGKDERGRSGVLKYGTRRTEKCETHMQGVVCVDGSNSVSVGTSNGDSGGPLLIREVGVDNKPKYRQVGVVHGAVTTTWLEKGQIKTDITMVFAAVAANCPFINT